MKARHWVWTSFEEDQDGLLQPAFTEQMVYQVYQAEICPSSSRRHFQGYTEFKNTKSLAALKMALGFRSCHAERRRGSREQARDYAMKNDTRIDGEIPVEEGSWNPPCQGKRNDLLELRDACEKAKSLADIIADDDNVAALAKYGRFAERVFQAAARKRARPFRNVEVFIYWGKSGTGKTREPYELGAFKWECCKPEWWDGYDGEDILLIDEFYGFQMDSKRLLTILDGYQCRLPIKGGFTYAQWTKVYITSNKSPESWYDTESWTVDEQEAFDRRITEIKHFI